MENVGIFMAFRNILQIFGIFNGPLISHLTFGMVS
jgi:hypothetical protein